MTMDREDFYLISDLVKVEMAASLIRETQSLKDDIIDGQKLCEVLIVLDEWIAKHEIGLDVRLNG